MEKWKAASNFISQGVYIPQQLFVPQPWEFNFPNTINKTEFVRRFSIF